MRSTRGHRRLTRRGCSSSPVSAMKSVATPLNLAGGNRRLRFHGTLLNDVWLHHRVTALKLRRLLNLGLTRTAGTWAIP